MAVGVVNYEEIARKAREIRMKADDVNRNVYEAYMTIEMMKKDWYGVRYNTLAVKCNSILGDLNKLMALIVKTIPFSLETVANNYAIADRGQNVVAAQQKEPQKILEIIQSNTQEMRFEPGAVASSQSKINTHFNTAITNIDAIETIFNSITWQSSAADTYRTEFKRLKAATRTAIGDIQTLLSKLIQEAITDMESAEKHNTVS